MTLFCLPVLAVLSLQAGLEAEADGKEKHFRPALRRYLEFTSARAEGSGCSHCLAPLQAALPSLPYRTPARLWGDCGAHRPAYCTTVGFWPRH